MKLWQPPLQVPEGPYHHNAATSLSMGPKRSYLVRWKGLLFLFVVVSTAEVVRKVFDYLYPIKVNG